MPVGLPKVTKDFEICKTLYQFHQVTIKEQSRQLAMLSLLRI